MSAKKSNYDYDMIVIGSGPSGHSAAIQAAKLRKKVAIVEGDSNLGGVWTNTGTVPSKSFRESVLYLSGFQQKRIYGSSYRVKSKITMNDLTHRISSIVSNGNDVIEDQLRRNGVDILNGYASFIDNHSLLIESNDYVLTKTAEYVVIATGTRPNHPPAFEVDGKKILDSDDILSLKELPRSLVVVGGGIIGMEYSTMFGVLGVETTVVEAKTRLLPFIDREIVETLKYHMRNYGITLRLGEEVKEVSRSSDDRVLTVLKSGKKIVSDAVLVSAGRQGATEKLNLDMIGIEPNAYGKLDVDEHYKTSVPNIYAVGDVIGFPALASTGKLQGRIVASSAFGLEVSNAMSAGLPFGIYTIPTISMVGETEQSLTDKQIPYETGIARYKEITRGQLIGDDKGMLKLLIHSETRELLGVHIIGDRAAELIHLGQAVLKLKGTIEYFIDTVFNHPTLTECYSVAALDALNKFRDIEKI